MTTPIQAQAFGRVITLQDAYQIMEVFLADYQSRGDSSISDFLHTYAGSTSTGLTTDPAAIKDFVNAAQVVIGQHERNPPGVGSREPLPNAGQMRELGMLIQQAFVDLRSLSGEQAHDLAYAFHNLPAEIFGWGTWSTSGTRARLRYYQSKHSTNLGFDYVKAFDEIFPEPA